MFCSACGAQNAIDSAFCTACGARLGTGPQPAGPAAEPAGYAPSHVPHYDYSRPRRYGASTSSVLGWVMLVGAAAGLVGCFLPFRMQSDANILGDLEYQKWLLTYPAGFGLILLASLFLGLGVGAQKMWMTFCGIGVGLAVSGVLFFSLSTPSLWPSLAAGAYLIAGGAGLCLIVALVEGFWPT